MTATTQAQHISIYEWLCCPECGSREIIRGPRFENGAVELRCEDCDVESRVGL